jgi:hypothetical protein
MPIELDNKVVHSVWRSQENQDRICYKHVGNRTHGIYRLYYLEKRRRIDGSGVDGFPVDLALLSDYLFKFVNMRESNLNNSLTPDKDDIHANPLTTLPMAEVSR